MSANLERVRMDDKDAADTYDVTFSSDDPIEIFPGYTEILGHDDGEVRSEWIASGNAPLLWNHDRTKQIGIVESARFEGGKGIARVRIAPSAEKISKDLAAGIIKNVSVGYRIMSERMESETDTMTTYRVTGWEAKEISFVTIPADKGVGIRSEEIEERKRHLISGKETTPPETQMSAPEATKEESKRSVVEITNEEREKIRKDSQKAERERQSAIARIASTHKVEKEAERAINEGTDPQAFAAEVLDILASRSPGLSSEEIGLTKKEVNRYSMENIGRALIDGDVRAAEFEREVSDAIKDAKQGGSQRADSFAIPDDVILRGWRPKDERYRALMGITTGDTSSTNIVPPDYRPELFIEALRENSVLLGSGVQMIGGLVGDTVDIPREILDILFYWVGEDTEPTEGVYGTDQVHLNYKTIAGRIPFTRRAGKTTAPVLETLLLNNIRKCLPLAIEQALISSTESSTVPGGVFQTSGVGSVTTSGTLTHSKLLQLEEALGNANAPTNNAVGFTNTHVKRLLLETEKFASTGQTLGRRQGDGSIMTDIGNFNISNLIPATFSSSKSGIMYGNPNSLIVGMWGGIELTRDTATKVDTGGVVLRVFQDLDAVVGQPAQWAVMTDIT